nr:LOW QUALITY PROTEIN: kallikrein-2-like [Arvicanthis niloticus]
MWFLVLCLVLSLEKYGALPFIQSRIIGGWEYERHSQPWQAAVYHYDRTVYGGVLVQPQWVLTAARCFSNKSKVRLGHHSLSAEEDTGQYVPVRRSIPHPFCNMSLRKHTSLSPDADNSHDLLLLLQLSEPASITEAVSVMSLPTEEPKLGSHCLASGWGSTSVCLAIRARMLQCVGLNPMSNDVCENAYSQRVTEFVLCAGHQKGSKDTCMASSPNP